MRPLVTTALISTALLWTVSASAVEPMSDSDMSGLHIEGGDVLNVQGPSASSGESSSGESAQGSQISIDLLNQKDPGQFRGELGENELENSLSRSSNPSLQALEEIRVPGPKMRMSIDPARTNKQANVNEQGQLGIQSSTFINSVEMLDMRDHSNQIRGSYFIRNMESSSNTIITPGR